MTDVVNAARLVRTQGVTASAGFRATGIAAGIKESGALDLALVFNEGSD
jgi:glutamate N-acetyltransferase/amino-acid N-acetyltransferase